MTEPTELTYAYLRRLYAAARRRYDTAPVSAASEGSTGTARPVLYLRHDIDLCPERAVRMAELEADLGITATYMVRTSAPVYRLENPVTRAHLRRLVELGQDIGLHFDTISDGGGPEATLESLEVELRSACERLGEAVGAPVGSLSFHCPQPQLLRGPLMVAGRVNAYAAELMEGYISDSAARFREGDPLARLDDPARPLRQLLIHPIWWGAAHQSGPDRLQSWFQERTASMSSDDREKFDRALAAGLPHPRRAAWEVVA